MIDEGVSMRCKWIVIAVKAFSLHFQSLMIFLSSLKNTPRPMSCGTINSVCLHAPSLSEGTQSLGKLRDKSFCRRIYRKIKGDTNIAFRIIGLLMGAPTNGVSTSLHERLFVSICLLWSLTLFGAFQVSADERRKVLLFPVFKLNLLRITNRKGRTWLSGWISNIVCYKICHLVYRFRVRDRGYLLCIWTRWTLLSFSRRGGDKPLDQQEALLSNCSTFWWFETFRGTSKCFVMKFLQFEEFF